MDSNWSDLFKSSCVKECSASQSGNAAVVSNMTLLFRCYQKCGLSGFDKNSKVFEWGKNSSNNPNEVGKVEPPKETWANLQDIPSKLKESAIGATKDMASSSINYALEQAFVLTDLAIKKAEERNLGAKIKIIANVGVAQVRIETRVEKKNKDSPHIL